MRNFADAYQILKREEEIPAGFRVLLVQLSLADDDVRFWNTLERILKLLDRPGNTPNLQGEVLVDCAYWVAKRSNYNRAEKLLAQARLKFVGNVNLHNAAVAAWMRGTILWQLPDSHDSALTEWMKSIDLLKRVRKDGYLMLPPENARNYKLYISGMEDEIAHAVAMDRFTLQLD